MFSFMRFPGFLYKACTLSYDDGVAHDRRLVEIMRKYGLRGTFNINSKNLDRGTGYLNADEMKEVYGDDMDIALHGFNHFSLARVTPDLAIRDVVADRDNLERTFGRIIRGMAYANGSYNDDVVAMLRLAGVVYSRTTKATYGFELPEEWLTLHPTCHHRAPELFELLDKFLEEPEQPHRIKPKLFYLWGHSYEFPRDDNWDVIEKFGKIMSERKDVWHATNMEVYDYVKAYESLVFSSDFTMVHNPSSIDVYLFARGKNFLAKSGETVRFD
jgi:hypothetical protein